MNTEMRKNLKENILKSIPEDGINIVNLKQWLATNSFTESDIISTCLILIEEGKIKHDDENFIIKYDQDFKNIVSYNYKEVSVIYNTIIHPAAFDVGCGGCLCVRQYEYPIWAVESDIDKDGNKTNEVKEFDNPMNAAIYFVKKRGELNLGLD